MNYADAVAAIRLESPLSSTDVDDLVAAARADVDSPVPPGNLSRFDAIRASYASLGKAPDRTAWQRIGAILATVEDEAGKVAPLVSVIATLVPLL